MSTIEKASDYLAALFFVIAAVLFFIAPQYGIYFLVLSLYQELRREILLSRKQANK